MPEKKVDSLNIPWALVMQEMVSVDLHIHYWRGKTKLSLQEDLGLIDTTLSESDPAYRQYLQAVREVILGGQRRLLPPDVQKRLARIERTARGLLDDMSFATRTIFGNLMPRDLYFTFVERLTQQPYDGRATERGSLQADFLAMRDSVVDRRDEIERYIRRSHRSLAVVAWRLSQNLPIDSSEQAPAVCVEDYLNRVVSALPGPERIFESFVFDWTVAEIPVPDEAIKQVKLDELEQQRQRLDQDIRDLEAARERVQSRAEYEATLEVERDKRQAEREEAEQRLAEARKAREKVERDLKLQREIGEKAAARLGSAIEPALAEITTRVRSMLYDATINAMAAVKSYGRLPPQSIGALKKLISQAAELNWTQDDQIGVYLQNLRAVTAEMAGYEDGEAAVEALNTVAVDLKAELNLLAEPASGVRRARVVDNDAANADRLEPDDGPLVRRERREVAEVQADVERVDLLGPRRRRLVE